MISSARFFGLAGFALALVACGPSTFRLRGTSDDEAAVVAKPVTIAFRSREPGAPTRSTERVTVDLRLTVHPPGKPAVIVDAKSMTEIEKVETVVATGALGPSSLKVSYEEAHMERVVGGSAKDVRSPLAGHTYLLRVRSGKLDAEHADGTAPSVEESKLLALAYHVVTKTPPQGMKGGGDALFVDRSADTPAAIEVGQRVALFEDDLRALFVGGPTSEMKVGDVEVTLLGVPEGANEEAVFQVGVTTDADVEDPNPLHMHTLLRGRWIVGTDSGWTHRFLLGGPTEVSASGPSGTVEGTGTMRVELTFEYGKKPTAT